MQRILNDPSMAVEDMIRGFVKAFPQRVSLTSHPKVLKSAAAPVPGKVGVVTGGGSGHDPAFVGYLGQGLCDAVAVGLVFSSPPATAFHAAFRAADSGRGVVCLYGNYAGDNMNVKMALEMAEDDGIRVKTVVANDDVASAPAHEREKRRGVAGEVLMWKVGGAKAAMGADLDKVVAAARKAMNHTRSIGVGLTPCVLPTAEAPHFSIDHGKMEIGIGHHGEPGVRVEDLGRADEIARKMVQPVLEDLPFQRGDDVVVLVSGLGATPMMEIFILFDSIHDLLVEAGLRIHVAYVGEFFTSLQMAGVTFTMMKLDEELRECIDFPCDAMGLTQLPIGGFTR